MSIIYVKNHKVLDLPFSFMFHPLLQLLHDLAILGEDVARVDLGDHSGFDSDDL
jgi:hypothetical protein